VENFITAYSGKLLSLVELTGCALDAIVASLFASANFYVKSCFASGWLCVRTVFTQSRQDAKEDSEEILSFPRTFPRFRHVLI
jgi:hypothetical protein